MSRGELTRLASGESLSVPYQLLRLQELDIPYQLLRLQELDIPYQLLRLQELDIPRSVLGRDFGRDCSRRRRWCLRPLRLPLPSGRCGIRRVRESTPLGADILAPYCRRSHLPMGHTWGLSRLPLLACRNNGWWVRVTDCPAGRTGGRYEPDSPVCLC